MKNRAKNFANISILAGFLAFILIISQTFPALAVTVTQEDIDALIQEAGNLEEQQSALNDEIINLSDMIAETLEKKELLDRQIADLSDETRDLETRIESIRDSIAQKEENLSKTRELEAERYALFCERVRAMEESGENYRLLLFQSNGIADFLSRLDFIGEIMDADQRVIENLREIQDELREEQSELDRENISLEAALKNLDEKRVELDQRRTEASQIIAELEANKADAENNLEDLYLEEDEIQERILILSEQYEQQQRELEAALQADMADWYGLLNAGPGGYAWPVNSHKINSTFGGRASPGGIGSTNHKGVDIGGVGYGTPIHASKAGLVIVSERSSSYGNYVVISHGADNTTLYAHMEQRMAEVGDYVEQGDIIGLTGSTGISTGPHLHFEITENGVRINPLIYLTDYYF